MAFVTVSLTDEAGTLIPQACDQLEFEVTGAGCFEAVCNGDATSLESFKAPTMKLFNGQAGGGGAQCQTAWHTHAEGEGSAAEHQPKY